MQKTAKPRVVIDGPKLLAVKAKVRKVTCKPKPAAYGMKSATNGLYPETEAQRAKAIRAFYPDKFDAYSDLNIVSAYRTVKRDTPYGFGQPSFGAAMQLVLRGQPPYHGATPTVSPTSDTPHPDAEYRIPAETTATSIARMAPSKEAVVHAIDVALYTAYAAGHITVFQYNRLTSAVANEF